MLTGLMSRLSQRAAQGKPVRGGLIGAGRFGTMFLNQVPQIAGLHLMGIADLSIERTKAALQRAAWPAAQATATSFADALQSGKTFLTQDSEALIAADGIEVIVEATGIPSVGVRHALSAFKHGKHIVMVNVEADALAGPLLAQRAESAGVMYSLAYGDQPALICELVDWARACGFEVIAAGKGTKHLPFYHQLTPNEVWKHFGMKLEDVERAGLNAQMYTSFMDGTKSAIEMTAVANATGLSAPSDGLQFPPCGSDDLAHVLRPRADGGLLEARGMVEVVSSLEKDGRPVYKDLRWGVYVVCVAHNEYGRRCFDEYGLKVDATGNYAAFYRPHHLVGLEVSISVLNAALRGEATGAAQTWNADVVATAKRNLEAGEVLDGEGGYCVYGKCVPAATSLTLNALPIGLAHRVTLKNHVAAGQVVSWADVDMDENDAAIKIRREMERMKRQP
jgi:predicted homoserine dehydrogenase-like protein